MPPHELTTSPAIIALAADMVFAAKIRGAAQAVGVAVEHARTPKQLLEIVAARADRPGEEPRLIIVDLEARGLDIVPTIEALQRTAPGAHILAYVSHTNATAIQQARSAGVDKVLARSAFVTGLADILRSA